MKTERETMKSYDFRDYRFRSKASKKVVRAIRRRAKVRGEREWQREV